MISLLFYAWGEVFYIVIMLASICINYSFGLLIHQLQNSQSSLFLALGILANLLILASFKYANFIVDNINILLRLIDLNSISLSKIHLPLGISFFTFQAISYIVDVYRKETLVQKNILDLALYISLFPQLIAGPIIRYHDIALQISQRTHSTQLFASGIHKFIFGLAKKMLIANPLGEVADNVFALSHDDLSMPIAWIGIMAYSFQIYFDFSGYSDMAIGLGRMLGFQFLENFNYPYISKSLREFWRRWHISLSSWFRDYVYFALGGNRVSTLTVYRNLLVVFILTGIWHGASWNFLAWGLFHGVFLALEHAGFNKILDKLWKPIQHLYLLFIIIVAWVFFRAENLTSALSILQILFDFSNYQTDNFQYSQILSKESVYIFFIACILSTPLYPQSAKFFQTNSRSYNTIVLKPVSILVPISLLILSILKVASSTYNPFIYFRF